MNSKIMQPESLDPSSCKAGAGNSCCPHLSVVARLKRVVGPIILLLVVVNSAIPWRAGIISVGYDQSWVSALEWAFAQGKRFGVEIIFPYGPWSFLGTGYYYPGLSGYAVVGNLCLSLVVFWSMLRVSGNSIRCGWLRYSWAVGIVLLSPHKYFYLLGFLLFAEYFLSAKDSRSRTSMILALALGWAGLVKFSILVFGAWIVLLTAFDEVFRKRRFPLLPAIYACSTTVFWRAAGQRLTDLPLYLTRSLHMASAHSRGLSLEGSLSDLWWFGIAWVFLLAAAAWTFWERRRYFSVFPMIALAGTCLIVFKAFFMRQDGHVVPGFLLTLILVVFLLPALWGEKPTTARKIVLLTCAVLGIAAAQYGTATYTHKSLVDTAADKCILYLQNLRTCFRRLEDGNLYGNLYSRALAEIRAEYPLPEITGTVDVYPHPSAVIIAHNLSYQPRPTIVSDLALTRKLAQLNVQHLLVPNAPETILFDVRPVDHRFPSLEDALSWPEIAVRYDVGPKNENFLILKSTPQPRDYKLQPLSEITAKIGETVPLPDDSDGLLWVRLELKPTKLSHLISFLYKPPIISIAVTVAGREREFRLIPETAESGFLLSPLVENRFEFEASMFSGQEKALQNKRVSAVKVYAYPGESCNAYYQDEYTLKMYRLELPKR